MVRSQHLCRESMSATPALQVYSTAAMSRSFLSAVVGSGRETVLNVCLVVEEYLNYWNGFYCSFARWPSVTQKTVALLRMAESCVYKHYTPYYVRCEALTK